MRLPPALRGFLAASVLFTLLCLGTEAFCRWVLHWGGPYDYPLLHTYYMRVHRQILFPDFHLFFDKFQFFHSKRFYTEITQLSYPAPAVAVYKLFLMPQPYPSHGTGALARYGASLLLFSLALTTFWWRALVKRGIGKLTAFGYVVGAYLCSFALWFEFAQGNIEWVIWLILSGAVWAFCFRHFKTAAILIGVAGAMKIFPIIYLGLFIPVRRYREVVLTLVSSAASTVVGLWLVCPDIPYSWHETVLALTSFEHQYVAGVRPLEVGFDHSLFSLLKLSLTGLSGIHDSQSLLGLYLLLVAVGGMILFFMRIQYLPLTNQVMTLAIAAILLPPISYDYTLVHLYPGLVLLNLLAVQEARKKPLQQTWIQVRGLSAALLLLAFLLSPQSEIIWHGIRYAGQVKALALLALGYVSLRYPFPLPGCPASGFGLHPRPSAQVS